MKNKSKNKYSLRLIMLSFCMVLFANLFAQGDIDKTYSVLVNGKAITLYQANVYDPCCGIPSYGGPYWFCSFDVTGETIVEVTTTKSLNKLALLPESRGIIPAIEGQKATLKVNAPMQLVLEPDGKNGPLMIFANPPEINPPKESDPNVVYFGPGEHDAGAIELTDNQILYLAPEAVVKGGIHAKGKNITIRGRGILDCFSITRRGGPRNPVLLEECKNVSVEGIVIKDGWTWAFVPRGCNGVFVDNVKLLTSRVQNGDGFDISNSQDVSIVNSFVRSDDDCIAIKGMGAAKGQANENIIVENCILWTDKAHVWRIGCESSAEAYRNLAFKNIDVLHFPDLWTWDEVPFCISLEPADELPIENVLFQDIRIRSSGQKGFIDVRPKVTMWARTSNPGSINGVTFRNISFTGPEGVNPGMIRVSGPDQNHPASNILFENVTFNKVLITSSSSNVSILGFAKNVTFSGEKLPNATLGNGMNNIIIKTAPRHRQLQLVEAFKPRCVIYAKGGIAGDYKASIEQIQKGLLKTLKVQMLVKDEPFPVKSDGQPMIFIGDCPEAKEEGLEGAKLPVGGFEIKSSSRGVFIVGNGNDLKSGIDTFLEYFLGYKNGKTNLQKTDLIVGPTWIVSAPPK